METDIIRSRAASSKYEDSRKCYTVCRKSCAISRKPKLCRVFEYAVPPQGRRFDVERGGHCRADGICRRVAASDRLPDVGRGNVAAGTVGFVGTIFGEKGLWIVDPIDGTNNFVNGLPHFAVSVAFVRNGRAELGVIYNPVSGECFMPNAGRVRFLMGHACLCVSWIKTQ